MDDKLAFNVSNRIKATPPEKRKGKDYYLKKFLEAHLYSLGCGICGSNGQPGAASFVGSPAYWANFRRFSEPLKDASKKEQLLKDLNADLPLQKDLTMAYLLHHAIMNSGIRDHRPDFFRKPDEPVEYRLIMGKSDGKLSVSEVLAALSAIESGREAVNVAKANVKAREQDGMIHLGVDNLIDRIKFSTLDGLLNEGQEFLLSAGDKNHFFFDLLIDLRRSENLHQRF